MDKNLQAWIAAALDIIADLGPEIWFVNLHRPDDFTATDRWVSVKEEFPGVPARWICYQRQEEGRWRRVA